MRQVKKWGSGVVGDTQGVRVIENQSKNILQNGKDGQLFEAPVSQHGDLLRQGIEQPLWTP